MWRGRIVGASKTEAVFATPQHPYTQALIAAVPPDDATVPWRALEDVEDVPLPAAPA